MTICHKKERPQSDKKEEKWVKEKMIFVCSSCGYESAKWLGKCPACNEWNSFYEEKIVKGSGKSITKEKKMLYQKC